MASRSVNDFTIRVATVNGSGSQSSNLVITNAILRLGIPVAPKNVFPSNIEGLPTWFDIRVTPKGYQCRTRDVDVLVALNATTWQTDVVGVKPGGVVVHEAAFPIGGTTSRDDLTFYPVPFAELAKEHFADKGDLRKYLMNMIYVGALAQLLEIPVETLEEGLKAQFRTKPAAVELNMSAVRVGLDYARELSKNAIRTGWKRWREDRRLDVHGRQSRLGAGLRDGRLHRRRLVSDYAFVVALRVFHRISANAIASTKRPANERSPSSKPKTNWRQSAWCSAPAGRVRAR